MAKQIVHGSTFSGIGAPEVAAEMLGWNNLFHCEINPFGRRVLDYYFPKAKSYEDITKTDFSEWRGRITVLTGGFPCQPFSYAGKRRGSEDDRYLWPYMLKCIQEVRPTWFVGENVAGITTMVFPGEDIKVGESATLFDTFDRMERRERYVIEEICQQLEDIGYSVQPMLIPACAVGAPHRRDRVFFIAHDNEAEYRGGEQESPAEHDGWRTALNTNSGWDEGQDNTSRTTQGERSTAQPAPDTESEQGRCSIEREPCQPTQEQLGGGSGEGNNGQRAYADTEGLQCNGSSVGESYDVGTRSTELGDNSQQAINLCGMLPEERWRTFPTVAPVHRGNDGIPFDVARLTIPFGQWRKESLKAYGNAIVVQVMYEIFRAIDEIEQKQS